jgi:hypothetical protein
MGTHVHTHHVTDGFTYQNHPDHRNNSAGKSQWTISEGDELSVFDLARTNSWLLAKCGWGLFMPNGTVSYLGLDQRHERPLFVAKFVAANQSILWHGYPADHERHIQDRPSTEILRNWMDSELLPEAKIRKIGRGQPCSL